MEPDTAMPVMSQTISPGCLEAAYLLSSLHDCPVLASTDGLFYPFLGHLNIPRMICHPTRRFQCIYSPVKAPAVRSISIHDDLSWTGNERGLSFIMKTPSNITHPTNAWNSELHRKEIAPTYISIGFNTGFARELIARDISIVARIDEVIGDGLQ